MNRDIAIIGIGCKFPGTDSLDGLYEILKNGEDMVRQISKKRIKDSSLDPGEEFRVVGYLEDIDKFDHEFFNISLAEAQVIDPNHRILLEIVNEAIENSGNSIRSFNGSNTSVYVADITAEYYQLGDEVVDTMVSGNSPAFLAARIAKHYNLTGNCTMIDTACSSSLTALHIACNDLLMGDAEQAIVCAININLFPYKHKKYEFNIWSSDDKSRAFSAKADGMSCGEVAGCLVLKTLEAAIKDNDVVHAVIKSTAVNNNANRSASPSAPDSISQANVIDTAWKKSGINPEDMGFIEAHGSGTQLGDCLEIEALTNVFKKYTSKKKFCPISTIKSNMGHGYNASGIAGIIKAVLALKKRVLFPTIHFDEPNPMIDFENSGVYVNKEFRQWKVETGKIRYAGVTSLGASGTNCHVILSEGPEAENKGKMKENYLITVSAKNERALERNIKAIEAKILSEMDTINLKDISYTLNTGRNHYGFRFATVASSIHELLNAFHNSNSKTGLHKKEDLTKVIYIFSDYIGNVDYSINEFKGKYEFFEKEYNSINENEVNNGLKTFAFQYSMYSLLENMGLGIENILGVGIGKIVAGVVNGEYSLEQSIKEAERYGFIEIEDLSERVERMIKRETQNGKVLFVNIGPASILSEVILLHYGKSDNVKTFILDTIDNREYNLLQLFKELYLMNQSISFEKLGCYFKGNKIELPGYQFEKKRCWIRETPFLLNKKSEVETDSSIHFSINEDASLIETKIAIAWKDHLDINSVSLYSNFFDIGGDSLKATKIIREIGELFSIRLDFEDIYDYPTIKELGSYIKEMLGTEEIVKYIWKEVLKADHIEADHNFFEIGGHSLMANQVINRIKKEFNLELSFEHIYMYATLGELSRYVRESLLTGANRHQYQEIKQLEAKEYYSLSSTQKRLWMLSQLDQASVAYNTPFAYEITGRFNKQAFEHAINKIVQRHESLRTTFMMIDGEPVQKVIPFSGFEFFIEYHDYSGVKGWEDEIGLEIDKDMMIPFDLEKDILLKCKLYKVSEEKYIFYLNSHHIINDGWSTHVFLKELAVLYESYDRNVKPILEDLKIQYKDYAYWQLERMKEEKYQKDREYWLERLSGDLPVLNLPADRVRPKIQTYNGDIVQFKLSNILTKGLRNICRKNDCTLFTILLAAANILFYRYTGQNDIILGTSVAGRQHKDLENQIGLFINTICLRSRVSGHNSVKQFIADTRRVVLEAHEHQDFQFETLINELKLKRDISRSPIFDVLFELHNTNFISKENAHLKNIEMTNFLKKRYTSIFDMNVEFEEGVDEISGSIIYNTDLFDKERMDRLVKHFVNLIQSISLDMEQSMDEIEYMDSYEQQEILSYSSGKKVDYDYNKLVPDLIFEYCRIKPGHVAVVCGGDSITYKELNEKVEQMAWVLRENGVAKEAVVGIMADRSIKMIVSILAVWKAGGAYLPIDTKCSRTRLQYIIEDSGMKILIGQKDYLTDAWLKEWNPIIKVIDIDNFEECKGPVPSLSEYAPEQLAYIIYTSGSTGNPKGVMIEHCGMLNHIYAKVNDLEITENSIIAQNASQCFDISVWQFFTALTVGGTTVIYGDGIVLKPQEFMTRLAEDKVEILQVVPSYLSVMLNELDANQIEFPDLRYLVTTGERLLPDLADRWFKVYPEIKIVNAYGPTEASDDITHHVIDKFSSKGSISIGRPIQNLNVYILDDKLKLCPKGIRGEICVSGVGVGRGYINNEEKTDLAFTLDSFMKDTNTRLYRTGDIGYWNADGSIEFCGRKDYQVKINGFRVELGEIESRLLLHWKVKEAVVCVINDNEHTYMCAYIVPEAETEKDELRRYLKDCLPDYMIPSYFILIDKMPLTPNGKVDRKALPVPCNTDYLNNNYAPPKNQIEEKLVMIWQEVLNVNKVGINDNFFELGGDSIKALKVSIEAKKKKASIDLKDIYVHQTIKELGEYISEISGECSAKAMDTILTYESKRNKIINEFENYRQVVVQKYPDLNIQDAYPMSDIEIGLLFHTVNNPGTLVHHIQMIYQAKYDSFDKDLFNKVLYKVAANHENLRAGFNLKDFDVPMKIIYEKVPLEIEYIDISDQPRAKQEAYIKEYMKEDQLKTFNFEKAPIWHLTLFETGSGNKVFFFVFHQAVMDGWSNATLMWEIHNLYRSMETGKESVYGSLKNSYKEFVVEQNIEKTKVENMEFWRNELRGYKKPEFKKKDFTHDNPSERTSYRYCLGNEMLKKVEQTAKTFNTDIKSVCFSAYIRMLNIITGELDIVTGILAHNRPACEDGHRIIGYFLNMVPIRINLDENMKWADLIVNISRKLLEVKEYEKMPLSEIMRITGERYHKGNPITDTMFNFTDFNVTREIENEKNDIKEDMKLSLESNIETNTVFDMNIDITFGSLDLKIDSAIYNSEFIDKLVELFKNIIEGLRSSKDLLLSDTGLSFEVAEAVYKEIDVDFNF